MKIEMFTSAFWGILLIVFGFLLVIKYFFNIQLPVFRIVFGLFLIYLGIVFLIGRTNCGSSCSVRNENSTVFSSQKYNYNENINNYNCVFGESQIDFSNINLSASKTVQISAVFSEFKIKINPNTNVEIISNTVFGNTKMPDNSNNSFGSLVYKNQGFDSNAPVLTIKTNVVFGSISIKHSNI